MKTLVHCTLLSCLLGVPISAARAQQDDVSAPLYKPPPPGTSFEDDTVQKLVELWQREDNETVRRKAAGTLQQMGTELAPALGSALAKAVNEAVEKPGECARHLETVQLLAGILGRLGNVVSRDLDTTRSLIAVVKKEQMPVEVRQAAVEALGKIFANRSIFLILNRETFWVKERLRQPTPREMTGFLINETATFKDKFNLAKPPSPEKARELILDTRNVGRRITLYRKVLALLNELEELQEKDLATRINLHLSEIEKNLQIVASEPEKPVSGREAAARAEEHAAALHEEMAGIGANLWRWQHLNQTTSEVITVLRDVLDGPSPLLRFSAAEALGRIYGKLDW
jgi:HEAT repeat protein